MVKYYMINGVRGNQSFLHQDYSESRYMSMAQLSQFYYKVVFEFFYIPW